MNQPLFDLITAADHEDALDEFLTEHEPDLESVNPDGLTALEWACGNRAYRCAGKLLEAGATMTPAFLTRPAYWNLMDQGDMPLNAACYYGVQALALALLEAGAAYDTKGREGLPLHVAAGRGWTDVVERILDSGAAIELVDDEGATPLMHAAQKGELETIELLRNRGANVLVKNFAGESIEDLVKYRRAEVLKACGIVAKPEVDRTADARAATTSYIGHRVSGEHGALFGQEPATFWFHFADPSELKSTIKDDFEDYVMGWRWKEVVPVASVRHSDDIDRAVGWLFLDYRKGSPRVLITTTDTWNDPQFVDSIDDLALQVHGA